MNLLVCYCLLAASVLQLFGGENIHQPVLVGYTGRVSYAPGEEVALHVSTDVPVFGVEIIRHGLKPEKLWEQTDISGKTYVIPEDASSMGCRWPQALKLKIPPDWRSGYYEVTLRAGETKASCFFVLRAAEQGKTSKVLLQLSTNTYNAYNNWGGFSLYAFNGRGGNQGHRVSFQRPPASQFGNWVSFWWRHGARDGPMAGHH